jgi:hypothetical protein
MKTSKKIKQRIEEAGARYWAGDNISQFIKDSEKEDLINELTESSKTYWRVL